MGALPLKKLTIIGLNGILCRNGSLILITPLKGIVGMKEVKMYKEQHEEGYQAYCDGLTRLRCPYKGRSQEEEGKAEAWYNGWDQAFTEYRGK